MAQANSSGFNPMPAAGSVMPGVEGGVDASRGALLAAIAQQGSTGAAAFSAEAQRQGAAHQAAIQGINQRGAGGTGPGAPAALTAALRGTQNQFQGIYDMDRSLSQGSYNNAFSGISAANAAYMNQAKAAVPALRAQTEGQVAQIRAQLEEERQRREAEAAERAWQAEQRRIEQQRADIEWQQAQQAAAEERAFTREGWDFEREMRDRERTEEEALYGEGVSKEQAEKFAAGMEKRQGEIIGRLASDENGTFNDTFSSITASQPDLQGALRHAKSLWENRERVAAEEGIDLEAEGVTPSTLARYLVAWYTGGAIPEISKGTGSARDATADALFKAGIDPRDAMPGYLSREERAQLSRRYTPEAAFNAGAGRRVDRQAPPRRQRRGSPSVGDKFRGGVERLTGLFTGPFR